MPDRPHLSVTPFQTYLGCPLQCFFRYACGMKMPPMGETALGRTIHEMLKENCRQKTESGLDLPLGQINGASGRLSSHSWIT